MKTLLKKHNLKSPSDYFRLCYDALVKGRHQLATELFEDLAPKDKKKMIIWLRRDAEDEYFNFFIDQLWITTQTV